MSSLVLVPLTDGQWLGLEPDTFRAALAAGAEAIAKPIATDADTEPLVDAEALAAALNLPVTWIEQAARERRIPSVKAGRWVRFRRSSVERALTRTDGEATL